MYTTATSAHDLASRRRALVQGVLAARTNAIPARSPEGLGEATTEHAPPPASHLTSSPVRAFLLSGGLGPGTTHLAGALERTGLITVIGISSDPLLGIEEVAVLRPEVVLVDRFISVADGLVVARHLHHDIPLAAIVLRTPWPHTDRHDAERAGIRSVVDSAIGASALARVLQIAADTQPPR